MKYKMPHVCSVCGGRLTVTGLKCDTCQSELKGEFCGCEFCALSPEQTNFLKTFLRCRGSIKDMERQMGISYPTVKNNLEKLIAALGLDDGEQSQSEQVEVLTKKEIFDKLARKEISAAEAKKLLEELYESEQG